jgi:hypothetical protein
MVSINQHGLEVARRCYSGEEVEKVLQKAEHQRRCHRLKNNMNSKDHCLLSSTGPSIALGYGTMNK